MAYATRANVYALGLSPEAFARAPRPIEGVIPGSGTLMLRAHGLSANDPITLVVLSESTLGAPAAALPTGLTAGAAYAQPINSDTFHVSVTVGGSPVASFSDEGEGVFGIVVDHSAHLDAALDAAAAIIDEYAVAHKAPLQGAVLPMICAFLGTRIYVAAHAMGNPTFSKMLEPPEWLRGKIDRLFDAWMSGVPLRGVDAGDATPLVTEAASVIVRLESRGFLDEIDDGRV